ncbi:hypothetical protein WN55_03126 [Dufourea novaeangliae]|uniref:Uncharacterized protein n=1 Tax=Dufourea novaeangliae TaxID=178035 RepID=A0A154PJK8_DUFNO|nr:hypothetical protein WN55_03126 [Dufourea novaeangliae]
MESPPKYVALKDLFLPPENDIRQFTPTNRQPRYDSSIEISLSVDRSCAGGSYLERQDATEEYDEITSRNPIARRLEYSDFEGNGSFRNVGDFSFDREYPSCTPTNMKRRGNGE